MQGKLVEQDPNDEPASVLLERIKAEKEQLIKDKVIRREKALPPITDEEIPFEVPESWEWVRLGDIGRWGSGSTPLRSNPSYYGGDIPWLKTGELKDGFISESNENITQLALDENSMKLNPVGSVLIAMYGATIGKLGILSFEAATNQACCACIPFAGINKKFLFYYLMCERNTFIGSAEGGAQPNISRQKIVQFRFVLPPLEEQIRIVEKIDELFNKVDQYNILEQQITSLNNVFPVNMEKSILQHAMQGKLVEQGPNDEPASSLLQRIQEEKEQLIKDKVIKREKALPPIADEEIPFEIPESWEWVRLGDIGKWGSGSTPLRSNPSYYDGDVPWLKTGELKDGYITESNESITQLALEKNSMKLNPVGSVLIAMYGATIGRLGILSLEAATNQACCACVPFTGINNKFLFYYLMSERNTFIGTAEGGAQPNISRKKIVQFRFALPPLEEQQRIVSKIEEMLELTGRLKDSIISNQ